MNNSGGRARRDSTKIATAAFIKRMKARSLAPSGNHVKASGRAIDDSLAVDTFKANQAQLSLLRGTSNKDYKQDTMRIHFKGQANSMGVTPGTQLNGAKIRRSNWSPAQKGLSEALSDHLKTLPGFISASHNKGFHASEIAHIRAQHAGGMTDALGAHPASWHSNVEDMAREESQVKLAEKYGDNVRMKSTVYLHTLGDLPGTVKASRHKIYFRDPLTQEWQKKFDHLQDGYRNNINKSEVANLRKQVAELSPASTTLKSTKGIGKLSDISAQKAFDPIPVGNRSEKAPFFTNIKDDTRQFAGEKGFFHFNKRISKWHKDVKKNRQATMARLRLKNTPK